MSSTIEVECERCAPLSNWRTLAEIKSEPFFTGLSDSEPVIVVKQHRDTRELMVEIFNCEDGLDVTYTNGGVEDRTRSKWFRDIRTCRKSLRALRVRFLAGGVAENLRLRS